jgi:hypothetical protein
LGSTVGLPFSGRQRSSAELMALGEVPQRCSLKFPTQAAVA